MPLAIFGLLILPAATANASIGVGIQAGPVSMSKAAHPGGTYQLSPVYVINTGTQDETVTLKVQRISPGHGLTVPPSWIHVGEGPVRLGHNQSAQIPLQLSIPASAKPGRYFSDVVAHGSSTVSAGQENFAVAAATGLDFRIAPGAVSQPWFHLPSWWLPGLGGLIVIAAGVFFFRVSGVRIRVERKPAPGDVSEGHEHADVT